LELWSEKYRPSTFKDIVGLKKEIYDNLDNPPHFLFYGPAGCGKTTVALAIIKHLQADSLILNSSLDRKIETVRSKVKDFVTSRSSNNKLKIVFLDEADGIGKDAQNSLRNIMETYAKRVRFILTCNNINKIHEAIRESRCVPIEFNALPQTKILERLKQILTEEKCQFEEDALKLLIQKLYPDMRAMINKLQTLTYNGKENLTIVKIRQIETLIQKVIQYIKKKDFDGARLTIINTAVNPEEFFKELYLWFMKADYSLEKKEDINKVAMECNFYSTGSLYKNIPLEGFIFGLMRLGI